MMFKITIFAALVSIASATCSCNIAADGEESCTQHKNCTTADENATCEALGTKDDCVAEANCGWGKTTGCEFYCVVGGSRYQHNAAEANGTKCAWDDGDSACGISGNTDACDITADGTDGSANEAAACIGHYDEATRCNAQHASASGTQNGCEAIIGCEWDAGASECNSITDAEDAAGTDDDACDVLTTEVLCIGEGANAGAATVTSCFWQTANALVDDDLTFASEDFTKLLADTSCQHLQKTKPGDATVKCTWSPASLYTLSVCGLVLGYIL